MRERADQEDLSKYGWWDWQGINNGVLGVVEGVQIWFLLSDTSKKYFAHGKGMSWVFTVLERPSLGSAGRRYGRCDGCMCWQQSMWQNWVRGECMFQNERETETKVWVMSPWLFNLTGWNGQGGELDCIGSRFHVVRSKWVELTVESVTIFRLYGSRGIFGEIVYSYFWVKRSRNDDASWISVHLSEEFLERV